MTPPKRKSVDSKEDVAKNEPVQERRTRARGETMAADELSIPSVVEQGAASSSSPGPFSFYYFRKNCESCAKMDTYLNTKQMGVSRPQYRDAHKERVLPPEALTLAKSCSQVVAINRTRVDKLKLETASDADLRAAIIGPSGFLRAPTIIVNQQMFVGFNNQALDEFFTR